MKPIVAALAVSTYATAAGSMSRSAVEWPRLDAVANGRLLEKDRTMIRHAMCLVVAVTMSLASCVMPKPSGAGGAGPSGGAGPTGGAGPSGGGSAAGTERAASADQGGGSVKEQAWRRESFEEANGLTDANLNAYQYRHKNLVEACGHDISVSFDWKTFDLPTWGEKAASPGTMCSNGVLDDIKVLCGDKDYKAAAAKLKTLTCLSKPCDGLPRSLPGSDNSGPGFEYALSADHTNLNVSACNKSSIYGGHEAITWLKDNL